MPNMSLLELLFALLLVCVLLAVGGVAALVWGLVRRADGQVREVAELRMRLESGGQTQESQAAELRERLTQTQSVVEGLRSAITARQPVEDEARASLRRLESVIAGSSTRGAAGENILEETLKALPPEMLQRNVWVGGKVVELALRLPGGKLLPIDSKWVSSSALEQLAEPGLDAPPRLSARSSAGSARSASTSIPRRPPRSCWRSSRMRRTTFAAAPSSAPTSATSWWSVTGWPSPTS